MTSREWLALAVPLVPAVAARARRRRSSPCGRCGSGSPQPAARGSSHSCSPRSRSSNADDPIAGDWLVVDATAGVFVGVIGVVGLASALTSPAYLGARPHGARPRRSAGRACTTATLPRLLGGARRRAARREPRHRLAPDRGHDRGFGAPRRLQRAGSGSRGGLEVPRADDARARVRAARNRAHRPERARAGSAGSRGARSPRSTAARISCPRRSCSSLPAWRRRSAGRRCTTGFPTRTPRRRRPSRRSSRARSSRPSSSSRGAPTQALAPAVGEEHRAGRSGRLRARLARRRRPLPLARARVEASARLLEPRAHGRARPRLRIREPARDGGRRRARRRPRDREGPRLLRSDTTARARPCAGRRAATGVGRTSPCTRRRRWGSRSGRSPGCRRRRSSPARS